MRDGPELWEALAAVITVIAGGLVGLVTAASKIGKAQAMIEELTEQLAKQDEIIETIQHERREQHEANLARFGQIDVKLAALPDQVTRRIEDMMDRWFKRG